MGSGSDGKLHPAGLLSDFCSWPGFCIDYVTIDLLHCGDLGIKTYLLASLFIELFTMLGGVMSRCAEGLSELLFYIKLAAKQLGQKRSPINKLPMHMMKGGLENAPKSKIKGSESRHTVHCMNWILEHIFPPQTPYERVRQLCVKSLSEFYASLYVWDNGDIRGRTDALQQGQRFMVFYSELHDAHGPDSVLYRLYGVGIRGGFLCRQNWLLGSISMQPKWARSHFFF